MTVGIEVSLGWVGKGQWCDGVKANSRIRHAEFADIDVELDTDQQAETPRMYVCVCLCVCLYLLQSEETC